MVLTVIGTGFVGVVTSAVFADNGHRVYGLDIDVNKIAALSRGEVPFFEPDLESLVKKGLSQDTLVFTTDYNQAVSEADVVVVAVGTPSNHDGSANLSYVINACESLAPHLKDQAVVIVKSTVPPGTHAQLKSIIADHTSVRFAVASVPEFLREGSAVDDTLNPDRVVIGADESWAQELLLDLHAFLPGKRVLVSMESASLGKYASNAYLATRITFANQMAELCEVSGASISEVLEVAGADNRIGTHYWYPGLGYGGSCFPKDVKELATFAKTHDLDDHLTICIDTLNQERILKKMDDFDKQIGGFSDKRVAVLGLSFKPNTTDMREAPSLSVVSYLQKKGAVVVAYDPMALDEARRHFKDVTYAQTLEKSITGAEVIMLLVEWDELIGLSASVISRLADEHVVVIDTRNQYDKQAFLEADIEIIQIGNG